MGKQLKKIKKDRENKIIAKYDKLVAKTLEEYKDRTMGELWVELDRLKAEMAKELNAS